MANVKISELPSVASATTGAYIPLVFGGVTSKVQAGAGGGLDADTVDGADYVAPSTWTPIITAGTGAITSYTSSGWSSKIGNLVTLSYKFNIATNGSAGSYIIISNFPYTIGGVGASGIAREAPNFGDTCVLNCPNGGTTATLWKYNNTYPVSTGSTVYGSISYII